MVWQEWTQEDFKGVIEEVRQMQQRLSVAARRSRDGTIRQRCGRAELALRATVMILEADPKGDPNVSDPASYIRSMLRNAVGEFDLEVVDSSGRTS